MCCKCVCDSCVSTHCQHGENPHKFLEGIKMADVTPGCKRALHGWSHPSPDPCQGVCACVCMHMCERLCIHPTAYQHFSKLLPSETVFWWEKKQLQVAMMPAQYSLQSKKFLEVQKYYYCTTLSKTGFPMKTQLFGQMQWCLTVAPTVSFAPVTHNSPILPHMDCCKDHNHVALKSMDRCYFFYRANAVKSRL